MDVALHEIADGKLGYEVIGGGTAAEAPAAKPARKTRAKKSS